MKEFDLAELHTYEQARDLTVELLKEWLVKYQFRAWEINSSSGKADTDEEKKKERKR